MQATWFRIDPWRVTEAEYPERGELEEKLRFLIRYAILAPSVHNTQPWAFAVTDSIVRVFADQIRCLTAGDRDMRDLYVSLGCAVENLVTAAEHFGLRPHVRYIPEPENPMLAAEVSFEADIGTDSRDPFGRFAAITARRTNHGRFNDEPVPEFELHRLSSCCTEADVEVRLTQDREIKRRFSRLLVEADVLRFSDRKYVRELERWVRQGAYDTPWLIRKLHELACECRNRQEQPDADVLKGAPLLGFIFTAENDRASQLRAGRVAERIFLHATAAGLSVEPITYVLQVGATKSRVTEEFAPAGAHVQMAFRVGYGVASPPPTPRRPLEEVLMVASHALVGGVG